jgi:hypothetical protein
MVVFEKLNNQILKSTSVSPVAQTRTLKNLFSLPAIYDAEYNNVLHLYCSPQVPMLINHLFPATLMVRPDPGASQVRYCANNAHAPSTASIFECVNLLSLIML